MESELKMANYFTLTYDTTGPASPSISLNSNATYATQVLITATIGTTDGTTTGYQMKIWGDLDLAWAKTNGLINSGATGTAETDALWITYATSKQIQLSTGDATKNIYLKIRDDVNNPSAQASASIILNTALPTVTISGPDVSKISKQTGKDTSTFTFQSDQVFTTYLVKVVSASGADNTTGTTIPVTNGSSNTSATGTFSANTPITVTIKGTDLELASAGDGSKIIKVFVKNNAGQWSS
jgi:hypothetical protein